jgi:hypothetical protein
LSLSCFDPRQPGEDAIDASFHQETPTCRVRGGGQGRGEARKRCQQRE